MVTAKQFLKLSHTFNIIYDKEGNDSIEYILEVDKNSDFPLVYDSQGEPITCCECLQQNHYDYNEPFCENDVCDQQ